MTITLNGSTGITNGGGYTGDGISFADNAPTDSLVVNSVGNVGVGASSPGRKLYVVGSVGIASETGGVAIDPPSSGVAQIDVSGANALRFNTNSAERMRIDSSGNLLVGATSEQAKLYVNQTDGSKPVAQFQGTGGAREFLEILNVQNSSFTPIRFLVNNYTASPGSISCSTTNTSYNTTSDYRLKENVKPMEHALETVSKLKPCTYTWKETGEDGQGFIAHELQAVVPDCVTGQKDDVDAEGKPVYQGIDTSFLIATLCKAIQEQQEQINQLKTEVVAIKEQQQLIESLTARITALESK